ncbi:MAG: hypothetical protein RL318_2660 [Fibrobacterota bacterium]
MKILSVLLPLPLVLACQSDRGSADRSAPVAQSTPKELYESRCSSCHALHPLDGRTKAQWDVALDRMKDRAGLDSVQTEAVRGWLHQNAGR